jgi:nucleotide-binding universal stress UspA family protein
MTYKRILVGTDGSATAEAAIRHAARLAKSMGADLNLVSAYSAPDPKQVSRWVEEAGQEFVGLITGTTAAESAVEHGQVAAKEEGVEATAAYVEGDPGEVLITTAESDGIDLVVVGNKGMTGAKRFLLGSVPHKVSHHAPCDVLIVHTT